ncbi:hypothetical protein WN51_09321 [Melipona quadrifasciata]|uniref:Uncharacterized protein n=1 Tax=Melipona quadrifasciata TaxID=166423 RepID=A0A0M9A6V2_9HYME|nr:hypothetical protein WN51_09321 [Melipona quadrifasciata]
MELTRKIAGKQYTFLGRKGTRDSNAPDTVGSRSTAFVRADVQPAYGNPFEMPLILLCPVKLLDFAVEWLVRV